MGAKKKEPAKAEKEKVSKTPPPPSKSLPPKKEKDSSESFPLWIPEQLEQIEIQIQSKKRLLESLDQKCENISAEVKQNILIRDQQINSLNKANLALRNELKVKEDMIKQIDHSQRLVALQKELNELNKNKERYEENLENMKNEFEAAQANWDDEKDSLMLQQEAVVEEQQALMSKLAHKDSNMKSMKDDILQMSRVMNEMSQLNQELQRKMEILNSSVDEYRVKFNVQQNIEEAYFELVNENKLLIERSGNFEQQWHLASDLIENQLKTHLDVLQDYLLDFQSVQHSTPNSRNSKMLSSISHINDIIIKLNRSDLHKLPLIDSKQKEFEQKEKLYNIRINELTQLLDKTKKDGANSISGIKKLFEVTKDQNSALVEKNQNLYAELEKKESDIQRLKTKIQHQSARMEGLTKKSNEILQKESEYKASIETLQGKITGMVEERKSTTNQLNLREKRIKGTLAQIQVLREEIFYKDTEILKKSKETLKLEELLAELKTQVQKISSKNKMTEVESLSKINQELEAKDKQIAMLKEMLRASNIEIKAKESTISHMKRKSENITHSSRDSSNLLI